MKLTILLTGTAGLASVGVTGLALPNANDLPAHAGAAPPICFQGVCTGSDRVASAVFARAKDTSSIDREDMAISSIPIDPIYPRAEQTSSGPVDDDLAIINAGIVPIYSLAGQAAPASAPGEATPPICIEGVCTGGDDTSYFSSAEISPVSPRVEAVSPGVIKASDPCPSGQTQFCTPMFCVCMAPGGSLSDIAPSSTSAPMSMLTTTSGVTLFSPTSPGVPMLTPSSGDSLFDPATAFLARLPAFTRAEVTTPVLATRTAPLAAKETPPVFAHAVSPNASPLCEPGYSPVCINGYCTCEHNDGTVDIDDTTFSVAARREAESSPVFVTKVKRSQHGDE
ncbi:MAG: hypothetical protein LQ340_004747 [Diploschistes diacapsis]|nr:MAG: hypothetical protein LQ340_004747 [Diploschistes diacapsis]